MKRIILIVLCAAMMISCAGAQKSKNGKKAVKSQAKFVTAFISQKAPESNIVMVAHNRESNLYEIGLDFDGDEMPDRVDFYNCNEHGKNPIVMEVHGSWSFERSHTCRKVGFANWK